MNPGANTPQLRGMPLGLQEATIQIGVGIELPTFQHEECLQAYSLSGFLHGELQAPLAC